MQHIRYDRYGGPEEMRLTSFVREEPGPGEVLVRTHAASINPVDWKIRQGHMRLFTGSAFPRAMGTDFAGEVVALGAGVTDFRVGDAVLGGAAAKSSGAFAPLVRVKADRIVAKPADLSWEQAAALPTAGITAWRALTEKAALKPGQRVLVNGAMGGVGQAAVQIALALGGVVTARVGPRSLERAAALGAAEALDYTQPLPDRLNGSFDVILDAHGGLVPADADRLLRRGGVVVDINLSAAKVRRALFLRRQKLAFGTIDRRALGEVAALAAAGRMEPAIHASVGLENAIDLIARLERGERLDGKAIINFA